MLRDWPELQVFMITAHVYMNTFISEGISVCIKSMTSDYEYLLRETSDKTFTQYFLFKCRNSLLEVDALLTLGIILFFCLFLPFFPGHFFAILIE